MKNYQMFLGSIIIAAALIIAGNTIAQAITEAAATIAGML